MAAGRAVHAKPAVERTRKAVPLNFLGDVAAAAGLLVVRADGVVHVRRPLQDARCFVFEVPLPPRESEL
jgi:hypothetical protein